MSSAEQALGSSLGDQQAAITAYAKTRGLTVARMYVEAESAVHEKIERREQIRALMVEARDGDLVLCHRLDRWSRDPEFTYQSIRQLLERGASFFAVEDQCDPSTPEGDTMLGFRVLFAREEHKRIKQRMVGTRRLLRDRGYYVDGLPPHGYRRQDVKGAERNALVVVPEEAKTVRRVFALCIAGRPLRAIAEQTGLPRHVVNTMLHDSPRTYLGEVRSTSGEWIKGRHPPIVDADTVARSIAAIAARRLGRSHNKSETSGTAAWILRDIAVCALCDVPMTSAYGGTGKHYFRCRAGCTPKLVRVDLAEAEVAPMMLGRLKALRVELAAEPTRDVAPVPDTTAKRAKLDMKRARLLDLYADGELSRDELRVKLATVEGERSKLDATDATAARRSPLESRKARAAMLAHVKAIERAWVILEAVHRRRLATLLLSSVRLAFGRAPVPIWRSASQLAEEFAVTA